MSEKTQENSKELRIPEHIAKDLEKHISIINKRRREAGVPYTNSIQIGEQKFDREKVLSGLELHEKIYRNAVILDAVDSSINGYRYHSNVSSRTYTNDIKNYNEDGEVSCYCCDIKNSSKGQFSIFIDYDGKKITLKNTCLKDITGISLAGNKDIKLSSDKINELLKMDFNQEYRSRTLYSVKKYLEAVCFFSDIYGYRTEKSRGSIYPTKDLIDLNKRKLHDNFSRKTGRLEEIYDYINNKMEPPYSIQESQIKELLSVDYVPSGYLDVLASAYTVLQRVHKNTSSKGVASIKEKIEKDVYVISVKNIGSHYRNSQDIYVYTFKDSSGNIIITYTTSKDFVGPVNAGTNIRIGGIVKDYQEYESIKQTVVTKIKLIESYNNNGDNDNVE